MAIKIDVEHLARIIAEGMREVDHMSCIKIESLIYKSRKVQVHLVVVADRDEFMEGTAKDLCVQVTR